MKTLEVTLKNGEIEAETYSFEGSDKQVMWAKDIVNKAKNFFDSEIARLEADVEKGYFTKTELENSKILSEISTTVLSNLASVWTAKDVIENREYIGCKNVASIWERMGIKRRGNILKIDSDAYSYQDLKDPDRKKELERKALQYLKSHKNI